MMISPLKRTRKWKHAEALTLSEWWMSETFSRCFFVCKSIQNRPIFKMEQSKNSLVLKVRMVTIILTVLCIIVVCQANPEKKSVGSKIGDMFLAWSDTIFTKIDEKMKAFNADLEGARHKNVLFEIADVFVAWKQDILANDEMNAETTGFDTIMAIIDAMIEEDCYIEDCPSGKIAFF